MTFNPIYLSEDSNGTIIAAWEGFTCDDADNTIERKTFCCLGGSVSEALENLFEDIAEWEDENDI